MNLKSTLLLMSLLISSLTSAQIVITEINYNCSGSDDFDFLELYNNSGSDIQMQDYYMPDAFAFTFPAYNFAAGSYLLLVADSLTFKEETGLTAMQWTSGTLSGSGEDISIYSADSVLIDYVDYEDDTDGWSLLADGRGLTLSLCDFNADNEDPANWQVGSLNVFSGELDNTLAYGSPGEASDCASGPIFVASRYRHSIIENLADTAYTFFYLSNSNGIPSSLEISVDPSSTASPDEYQILQTTLEYNGLGDSVIIVGVTTGTDDSEVEGVETLILNITANSNVERVLTNKVYFNMYDDDAVPSGSLLIAGVFSSRIEGPTDEYGVELYALKDIPDLSVFGVGTANNGGGTDGIEIPLPAVSLSAGDFFFVSDNKDRFFNFFGIESDYKHASIFVTGNDAIELFEHGTVIDTYGEIDVDGELSAWDYEGGWATRFPLTTASGSTFIEADWIYSGIDVLTGSTNTNSISPYPLGQFIPNSTKDILPSSFLNLQLSPNPVDDVLYVSFESDEKIEAYEIVLYDISGKLMLQNAVLRGDTRASINVADFAKGSYLVMLKTNQGIATRKFLK